MMAEVLEQEVAHDSEPPTAALAEVPANPERQLEHALDIAEAAVKENDALKAQIEKFSRKRAVTIGVRYDERELSEVVQLRLATYRMEIQALNKALRERNILLARLRADVRLRDRVLRLKEEARRDGRGQLLAEVTEAAASVRASATVKAAVAAVSNAEKPQG